MLFAALVNCSAIVAQAQEITITPGTSPIALNEYFTITVTTHNTELRTYSAFPDIPGFVKAGTSSGSNTNIINGNVNSSQFVVQNYQAEKEGSFTLAPFSIMVNGKSVNSPGIKIKVGPPMQKRYDPFSYDPMEEYMRHGEAEEFVNVKEDAFLGLATDKSEVYVGEGVNVTLSLYVAENNKADMSFVKLGEQLSEMVTKIRPANCWEENFGISEIQTKAVTINSKKYTRWLFFQASYFPLNTQPLNFPALSLQLVKLNPSKNPGFFGPQYKEELTTFKSKPVTVRVKDLPDHPLKDEVAVGNFRLSESLNPVSVKTGRSVDYVFKISGDGNIASVEPPAQPAVENFEFYPPNTGQNISRNNDRVFGEKAFSYKLVPQAAGNYKLGDYFSWIFFNPVKQKYDTLRSQSTLHVFGENLNADGMVAGRDGLYNLISESSNTLTSTDRNDRLKYWANIVLIIITIVGLLLIFMKR